MELHEMFEKIPYLFKNKAGNRNLHDNKQYHISNYPDSTKTMCGEDMGSHWDITTFGFRPGLSGIVSISKKGQLLDKMGITYHSYDLCPKCFSCLEPVEEPTWKKVLEHNFQRMAPFRVSDIYDTAEVVEAPPNYVMGWCNVQRPAHRDKKGIYHKYRNFNTPVMIIGKDTASVLANELFNLRKGIESVFTNAKVAIELYPLEDCYFLGSEREGRFTFCNFFTQTPPLEGVKVKKLAIQEFLLFISGYVLDKKCTCKEPDEFELHESWNVPQLACKVCRSAETEKPDLELRDFD
jgi:hypothetical protein